MGAQPVGPDMDESEQPEAERQRGEQALVTLHHRLVDGKLHVEGRGQHHELQHGREHERLGERPLHPAHPAPQGREA
ncbi:hypothetical protein [Microvirga arabica]|uniref:hypothetical protein n=1 Tax=Microvirga arabica TaxID=1128671 RepID=UPI00193979E4|nr:hypothetical protein [Microvirga arabica]MBM1175417.1 hypothetical protein [Microvirga arabica]